MKNLSKFIRPLECRIKLYLTADLYKATRRFYEGNLGIAIRYSWDEGLGNRGIMFQLSPTVVLELIDQASPKIRGNNVGLSLAVDDVWTLHARLTDLDPSPLLNREWGDTEFTVKDPSGFETTFYSPTSSAS